jgi:membrane protease YdiL (CAAX protease family)
MMPSAGNIYKNMASERSVRFPIHYGLILFVVIGYLVQNVLIYGCFSMVPEEFLTHSYAVLTLQGNIYILPVYVVLLIGALAFRSDYRRQVLIRNYALAVIIPGLLFTALGREAGHAFFGAIAFAFSIQWTVILIGIVHFWIILHRRHRETVP